MTAYELLLKTNHHIIKGGTLNVKQKRNVVNQLLAAQSTPEQTQRFYRGLKCPGNIDSEGRRMYPLYFIPPYNEGKKYRLITGQLPKTHLLSANHYELEILRILALWDGDNPAVRNMLSETQKRLTTTCFAHFCGTGECVGAGIAALRFLSALSPPDRKWIDELLIPTIEQYKCGHNGMASINNNVPVFYLYAALPQIASEDCYKLVDYKKEWIVRMLTRGSITGPAEQDTFNVVILNILKNALSMLPEYKYLTNREVYISDKDNRCYCDV